MTTPQTPGPSVIEIVRELQSLRQKAAATGDLDHPYAAEWNFNIFRDFPAIASALEEAVEALDQIASWKEGDTVTGTFDEPGSAQKARKALIHICSL